MSCGCRHFAKSQGAKVWDMALGLVVEVVALQPVLQRDLPQERTSNALLVGLRTHGPYGSQSQQLHHEDEFAQHFELRDSASFISHNQREGEGENERGENERANVKQRGTGADCSNHLWTSCRVSCCHCIYGGLRKRPR